MLKISLMAYFSHGYLCRSVTNSCDGRREIASAISLRPVARSGMENAMKKIYSVLVENRSGVLCKVAGLFSRRCFNINSLAVGETDDPAVSCMTIVSSGDQRTIEQIEKQLNKKLDVIKVRTFDEQISISRELMLVKIKYNRNNRRDIMENCAIMHAVIVDMSKHMMLIQICDTPERVQIFLNMLQTISIVEVARTGTLALTKCAESDG